MLDLLGSQFDEFAQELNSFAERVGQTHFRDDPVLDFVETAQEQIQIRFDFAERLGTGHVINQLVLPIVPTQNVNRFVINQSKQTCSSSHSNSRSFQAIN